MLRIIDNDKAKSTQVLLIDKKAVSSIMNASTRARSTREHLKIVQKRTMASKVGRGPLSAALQWRSG